MRRYIYGQQGDCRFYLTAAGVLYSRTNEPLAVLAGEHLLNQHGDTVAWFDGAFLRDVHGEVLGFVKGAKSPTDFALPKPEKLNFRAAPVPALFHPLYVPAERPTYRWHWAQGTLLAGKDVVS